MEKPTETITNKIFNYFENNHKGKNWTLFLIILGVVHSVWFVEFFHRVSWWQWALQIPKANFDIGTQNPYFIFLEILFIASSITRILIAIDIFYILANFCLVDDLLKIVWKKRRDEWRRWEDANKDYWLLNYRGNSPKLITLKVLANLDRDLAFNENIGSTFSGSKLGYVKLIQKKFNIDDYHIQYWMWLEIKKCRKAIAEEQKNEAKNLSLTKQ